MGGRLVSTLAVTALLFAACGTGEDVTLPPGGTPFPASEITLDECVIDRGTTPPVPATGTEFSTISAGALTVGSDIPYPPFEDYDEAGEPTGFDIELITEVAERIGPLEVDVIASPFDTIFTALVTARFDVVISAVTITQERKQTVDFTDPYFQADQSLAIRTTDSGTINGVEDLRDKTVGVEEGTTGADCARNAVEEQYGLTHVRAYSSIGDAFNDLGAGRVDAVLSDLPASHAIVEARTGFTIVQVILTDENYGIAVSRSNPNLREAINEALAEIRADGTYDQLIERWFDTAPTQR